MLSPPAPTRFVHVSDLHFGRFEDTVSQQALAALVERTAPELVIATGDLSHRGRRDQHERAAAFLRGLGVPLLVVPGNHDIPFAFPGRFTRTWVEFERQWETTRPVYRSDALFVVGLNSVRSWRHQTGAVRADQIDWATAQLRQADARPLKVVALHHHLINAPWRTRKRPVARRARLIAELTRAGAEVIVAGHTHQAAISERREFETPADDGVVTLAVAAGFGRPRPRRRGEARGVHLFEVFRDAVAVASYVWTGDAWEVGASRRFPRRAWPEHAHDRAARPARSQAGMEQSARRSPGGRDRRFGQQG